MSQRAVQQAFKLALSLTLYYWLALWMNWGEPQYGALAILLISMGTTGASVRKGVMRVVGTVFGLAVGMAGVALYAQDRLQMFLFLSAYLVVIGYFMPASRYVYAWFVAGFLGPLVWATTYGDVGNAFHYAIFRFLTTTAGVVIYTLVGVLLWPRQAGDQLNAQGSELWPDYGRLLAMYRRQMRERTAPPEAAGLRAQLDGAGARLFQTLEAAYADTPSVIHRKRAWEALRINLRAFDDTLELWRESIDDCRKLDLDRLLPDLELGLDRLEGRLARVEQLWSARADDEDPPHGDADDAQLLEALALTLDAGAAADLSTFERAALVGSAQQLRSLDSTTCGLLRGCFKTTHARQPTCSSRSAVLPGRGGLAGLLSFSRSTLGVFGSC